MNQVTRSPLALAPVLPEFWRQRSLQLRLLVFVLLVLLLAFLLVAVGLRAFVVTMEQRLWEERQQLMANSAAEAIDHSLATMQNALALLVVVDDGEAHPHPNLTQRLLDSDPGLLEIVHLDAAGGVVESAYRDAPLLHEQFADPAVRQKLAGQAPAPQLLESPAAPNQLPFLLMVEPDNQGGLVAARLARTVLTNALKRLPLEDQGYAYLLNGDGTLVAHSQAEATLTTWPLAGHTALPTTAGPDQPGSGSYTNQAGIAVIGAVAPVGETGWLVIAEMPRGAALALSQSAFRLLVGSLLLMGVIALATGGYFVRQLILLPLFQLRMGVERIGGGDLEHRLALERPVEFAQVALAFNRMAGQLAERQQALRQAQDELEMRVQERTAALAVAVQELQTGQAERQAAEEALRQSERAQQLAEDKYRALVEQLPFVTYTAPAQSYDPVTYMNQGIAVLGFTPEEWLADPDLRWRLIHPDDQARVRSHFAAMWQTGEPLKVDYRILAREGRQHWFREQVRFVCTATGERSYAHGVIFDITEQKETEEALRDSVQRIQLIADNLPALIAYIDHGQYYRFANRQFEEWYATGTIVGKHLREIAGEPQYQAISGYVETALAGAPITFDYSRVYPDGRPRFVEISYIPHIAPEGTVLGFFTLVQDLTERKVAEEQIKASLEEKVVLLKEIHHRVKNNLQVISSLLYLQSEQVANPQVQDILRDSQNRVKSMALIHEKLYQAKDQVRVDVAEYIQNLTSYLFRSYAAQAGRVHLRVDVANVQLAIDTAMPCGLIINELISNALKHGFVDGRTGEIYVELQPEDKGKYSLRVGDTGVGMPEDVDLFKTSSLGLQLVYTLVRQLDGEIEFQRNGGTHFQIRFADSH